jgi:nitrate/TMAO reductase-like tetraheme cytochrome c subunit
MSNILILGALILLYLDFKAFNRFLEEIGFSSELDLDKYSKDEYVDEYSSDLNYTDLSVSESNLLKQQIFDEKINKIKYELSEKNIYEHKATRADVLDEGVYNLPHEIITKGTKYEVLPDVEIPE